MPTPDLSMQSLYREHHQWLVALLRRKLGGNVDNAADLAQDTFERILRGPAPALQQIKEPRAYLTTVASRLAAQYFRRQALEQAYMEALALQPEACTPSVEEQALVLEALAQVSRVLDGLPTRTRAIFLLSQLDGWSYPQIAADMGLSINVVQKAMSQALRHCYMAVYG
ncbi:sigma-70 family RNA polymerase sigma factor [Kerstersia similis]|uniref:sigma-70 family RNA polymerase sigma factor n=1 Tax=Kerstersia similis TaxID=206505 RepID=UPI0039EED723